MNAYNFSKLVALCFLFLSGISNAQQNDNVLANPVTWSFSVSKEKLKTGETVELIFKGKIKDDWYMYSSDFSPDLGPNVTTFSFVPNATYKLEGKLKPIGSHKKHDDIWGGEYTYFKKKIEFKQKVKILKANPVIKVTINYQTCNDVTGTCLPPFETSHSFKGLEVEALVEEIERTSDTTVAEASVKKETVLPEHSSTNGSKKSVMISPMPEDKLQRNFQKKIDTSEDKSLFYFFILAFGSGLVSLLTPCVFPMIPLTVTFFTNASKNRAQAVQKALIYGASIVLVFTLIGLILARLNGPEFANFLSTHWAPNLLFFVIFIFFGLSFLGLFELTLPSGIVNKVDQQADKGGYYGIFFMGLTLVLVSFSCTAPIVGSLLVEAAGGKAIKPIIGMLGYSLAFAIPFTLFAMFPSWLNALPKSGGWLNVIKVVLGFVELALALKFLSIADQVYHWNILDREIYIAIWIAVFTLLGVYLLGKIKLPHDSDVRYTSVPRLISSIFVFAFVVYLIPGMFGAPLKALAGYLPPMSTHDFDLPGIVREYSMTSAPDHKILCEEPNYANKFKLPHGLKGYFEYAQAIKCAKEKNQPLFIDFTGHGCVNCREMEANVWSDPEVLKILNNDYLIVALYVDDKMELPKEQWYESPYDKKIKKTIGALNSDIEIRKFKNNAQPFYVLLDPFTEEALVDPIAYDLSVPNFIDFLNQGKANFKALHK